jgi:hypothetical protein
MHSTIAEKIPRICRIDNHLVVQTERDNYPPTSGGPVIPVNIFHRGDWGSHSVSYI